MKRVPHILEKDTATRFATYGDDLRVWVEAVDYECTKDVVTDVQAAANNFSTILPTLGFELATEKTEFLLVHGQH